MEIRDSEIRSEIPGMEIAELHLSAACGGCMKRLGERTPTNNHTFENGRFLRGKTVKMHALGEDGPKHLYVWSCG
jgi:hypothetical protein